MSKIRVAIVGCGYWGQNLIRNFAELANVEVAAVCDFNLNALARTKRRYPAVELKQDFQQVLADSRIHAVVIATPVSTHYSFARQALRAGKHVLVEKPLATSTQQVLDLMELADKHNRTLMVDHTFIYTGAVRHMRSIIDAGAIGELLYFDSVRISLGLVQSDINVIWDLAPHDFSIMDYLCSEDPVAVSATGAKHLGCPFENIAYVTAHFGSKMIAHFHLNWLAPVKVRKTLVGGTRKMIVYDDMETAEKVRIYDKGVTVNHDPECRERLLAGYRNGDMVAPNLDTSEALRLMAREFVESITQKRLPISDGYAGYRVVRLLEAAQQSMELNGQPVELTNHIGGRTGPDSTLEVVA
jgi:predicted dehydrogenase